MKKVFNQEKDTFCHNDNKVLKNKDKKEMKNDSKKDEILYESKCDMKEAGGNYAPIIFKIIKRGDPLYLISTKKSSTNLHKQLKIDMIQKVEIDDRKLIISLKEKYHQPKSPSDNDWQIKFESKDITKEYLSIISTLIKIQNKYPKSHKDFDLSNQERQRYVQYPLALKVIHIIETFQIKGISTNHIKMQIADQIKHYFNCNDLKQTQIARKKEESQDKEKREQLEKVIWELKSQNQQIQQFYQNLEQQIQEERRIQIYQFQKTIDMLKNQISKKQQLLVNETENNNTLRERVRNLEKQEKIIEKSNNRADQKQQLKEVCQKYQKIVVQCNQKIKKLQSELKIIIESNQRLKKLQCQFKKAQTVAQIAEDQLLKKTTQFENQIYFHIFQGEILQNYRFFKEYLKGQIEKYTKRSILKTRILYKYDSKNDVNFHHYIDGRNNIVVIIKTLSGMFLAGFSESCIKSNEVANRGGLILSLTNGKTFQLASNTKSVTYDEYYLIIGNSQIRIKFQQKKVFSNFGVSNSYFIHRGETVNALLGEGSLRDVNLQNYQMHQVLFK